MLQKCVITGTHLCWSREWWKDVCLFLASRGHSLAVKSLKSDNQSLFLLQYMIYKMLQSFKQPNLRSQFCGVQKKLCLAFLAPYNPQGWGRKGVTAMLQLLQVARVPFATHGAEMTGVGRTAEAWNWFEMMKICFSLRSSHIWEH